MTTNIEKKKMGLRIKQIRNELGLTMKEFGKKFDPPASDSIVSRWERGISSPNSERLKRISEIGNVSMFYLSSGKKAMADLSEEERTVNHEKMMQGFKKDLQDMNKELNEDINLLLSKNLRFHEIIFLKTSLNILKFASVEQMIHINSILYSLDQGINASDEDKATKDYQEFSENEIKDIALSLKEIYLNNKDGE